MIFHSAQGHKKEDKPIKDGLLCCAISWRFYQIGYLRVSCLSNFAFVSVVYHIERASSDLTLSAYVPVRLRLTINQGVNRNLRKTNV